MRILWVKGGKLLPVDTGGKIRSFNIARRLAEKNDFTLLSYYDGRPDAAYEAAIAERFPNPRTICTGAPEGGMRQVLDYLRRLPLPAPYAVTKFTHPDVQHTISKWFDEGRFDVAVCDFLSASLNFPEHRRVPCVLFQHNVETVLWQRLFATEADPLRKLSYRVEVSKMAKYEKAALRRFQHIVAVSQRDRDEMMKFAPGCPVTIVPTGVDTEKYLRVPSATADPPRIIFTGSMDWEPNIDAVQYFCDQIWPAVVSNFPDAKFQIVGRNPHPSVQRLQSESVEVAGTVPSVIDYLRVATIVVVPLRIGGGTRLKIYEAMAMGKAVVSTSIGAEGLDIVPGRDLLIADSPELFSSSIVHLLRERKLREAIETAAACVAIQYDWSRVAAEFENVLREAMASFCT